ncbi:MAG TPA: ring-cleaving dioxygenase [Candidatus Sulfopaludibacter sp.]|jgi:catechol 2,3-dioxygenase-like lactoylglutathione lyase family enzyme|nr:ring-cleaving dioxygenase [Candidatus Sulfopaludibacter sp.]
MKKQILGIHHVTAIAGDPQKNLDFYSGVLGLRLVKLTVNFDDPGTYHLYYGDGAGHPGTIITFFPWASAPRGRYGNGLVTETAFAIPEQALDFWTARFTERNVAFESSERFGEKLISVTDPDGLKIELIATATAPDDRAWQSGPVPLEFAIRGFHSATLSEADHRATATLLTDTMGFKLVAEDANRFRYAVDSGQPANLVDIVRAPEQRQGRVLVGTVHHIAWRTPDDAQQLEWLGELSRLEYGVSPVMDRKYFHSIYYREPGNILFEIATDPPGFAVDEAAETLGSHLVLPSWLESDRPRLETVLPRLRL